MGHAVTASDLTVQVTSPTIERETERSHASLGKLGMWTFLISDAVTFAALLVSCSLLRTWSNDWPTPASVLNLPLAGIMTVFLLASSGAMALALAALTQGNLSRFKGYLLLTIIGGSGFILLQAWEWSHLLQQGLTLTDNPWGARLLGASFYVLTGFHGCHVIAGLVYLAIVWIKGLRGTYHARHTSPVAIAGLYWYFVDVSWLFVLLVVYLF
jgi:cytochrome c oxidase subunit III